MKSTDFSIERQLKEISQPSPSTPEDTPLNLALKSALSQAYDFVLSDQPEFVQKREALRKRLADENPGHPILGLGAGNE